MNCDGTHWVIRLIATTASKFISLEQNQSLEIENASGDTPYSTGSSSVLSVTAPHWITQTELLGFSFGAVSPDAAAAPSCAICGVGAGVAGGCGATRLPDGGLSALGRRVRALPVFFGVLFFESFARRAGGRDALALASRLASDRRSTRLRRPSE